MCHVRVSSIWQRTSTGRDVWHSVHGLRKDSGGRSLDFLDWRDGTGDCRSLVTTPSAITKLTTRSLPVAAAAARHGVVIGMSRNGKNVFLKDDLNVCIRR